MRGLISALCLLLILPGVALAAELPQGVTLQRNVAYGPDNDQKMDIYLPPQAKNAPILLMVHGGAWRYGDKGMDRVVDNKLARWAPKGIIFVSINYRMQPEAPPLVQAEDVARALAEIQKNHLEELTLEILPLVSSPDYWVQDRAIETLGSIADSYLVQVGPDLINLLFDPDEDVRRRAIEGFMVVLGLYV